MSSGRTTKPGTKPEADFGSGLLRHINVTLVGEDGNIFALMGACARAVKTQGSDEDRAEWKNVVNRITDSRSYDEALTVIGHNLSVS